MTGAGSGAGPAVTQRGWSAPVSGLALALIIASSFAHASWNVLAKRAGGGPPFVWLVTGLSACLYAPVAATALILSPARPGLAELPVLLVSGVLHLVYFLLLQRGYQTGDLSLVYPIARGTGPMLSTVAAVFLFGERPSSLALVGMLMVVGSAFALAGGSVRRGGDGGALLFGVLTGVAIASYTVWDKHAVSGLAIHPLLLEWASNAIRSALLTPYALRRWDHVRALWSARRKAVLGVAVLSPLSYILFLTALRFTPVSYVAPARELSILIGTLMGTRLLAEGDAARRLTAAAAMVLGVIALALG